MKILAFSDIHRNIDCAREIVTASIEADLVIGAGDFAIKGAGTLDTLHILKECKCDVVIVHGNHDCAQEMSDFCDDWERGHFLNGSSVKIGGLSFLGLGGEIPSRNGFEWNAAESEEAASAMLNSQPIPSVVVTHTPPLGYADLQIDGTNEGSAAIRDYIIEHKPRLALCGHIHNAWGMKAILGVTPVYNLGPSLNWFEI